MLRDELPLARQVFDGLGVAGELTTTHVTRTSGALRIFRIQSERHP